MKIFFFLNFNCDRLNRDADAETREMRVSERNYGHRADHLFFERNTLRQKPNPRNVSLRISNDSGFNKTIGLRRGIPTKDMLLSSSKTFRNRLLQRCCSKNSRSLACFRTFSSPLKEIVMGIDKNS